MSEATRPVSFNRITPDGGDDFVVRTVAIEAPVSVAFNGIGYAVTMTSRADLVDFAVGFALSERLVEHVSDILAVDQHPSPAGHILHITLAATRTETLLGRVRHRMSDPSCALCGIENLEEALRPLHFITAASDADEAAIFAAPASLRDRQPLNRDTGAAQAAAQCRSDGTIVAVREDVGRHNAFDKLIGAMERAGQDWDGGFALRSSRCSYELVEKAALSSCPMLVTISALTMLAVERARAIGRPSFVGAIPIIGLWPADLADRLDIFIASDRRRSKRGRAAKIGAATLSLAEELPNIKTPDDLSMRARAFPRG